MMKPAVCDIHQPRSQDKFGGAWDPPLAYRVGGLLYMPAFQENIVEKLESGSIPGLSSLAFCLEDSIQDSAVAEAENFLFNTLLKLGERIPPGKAPLIFIRVRSPEQMIRLHKKYEPVLELVNGYILPKFDLRTAEAYLSVTEDLNSKGKKEVYIMPIMESPALVDGSERQRVLGELSSALSRVKPRVLNIRVGGNDLLNIFGLRCPVDRTIYDIGPVRDILMDVLRAFAAEYVVSGPVWNYFGQSDENEPWAKGLKRELALDRLNGFIGKTAIHPVQLPLIQKSLAVSREDYEDALAVLNWQTGFRGVQKSVGGGRMNEVKCHTKWAKTVKTLGDIYGILEK